MAAKRKKPTQTVTTLEHICRDEGYSPYKKPCPACMSQMSINGALLNRRTRNSGTRKATT